MNYFKRLETIFIIIVILVLGIAYGLLNSKSPQSPATNDSASGTSQATTESEQVQQVPAAQVRYQGVEGQTAMQLLKANYRVETTDFGDLGEFVKSIDGVEPDSSHFWSFYLNGSQAMEGASTYQTKATDSIEWRLEEIK